MNIAVTANDNYAYPLYIMLQTLFAGNSTVLIHVWLVHSRMSRENVELLQKMCEKKGQQFTEIKVSEDSFQKAPEFSHFTKEMYYRIMLAEWLPVTVERVLYLDPDLIVLDSLKGLYEIPEGDWCIAACPDREVNRDKEAYRLTLGLKKKSVYINSGVILFDLKKVRKILDQEKLWQLIEEKGSLFGMPDQDIINLIFEGKIYLADEAYNRNPNYLFLSELLKYNLGIRKKDPIYILHYSGSVKPWKNLYYRNLYQYYWIREICYTNKKRGPLFLKLWQVPAGMIWGMAAHVKAWLGSRI